VTAARNAFRVLLVLWAGSLWSVAIWVAPTLFYAQHDRHLAGMLAGRLFTVETWLAVAVALAAVLQPGRLKLAGLYAAAALLAVNEWGLRTMMAAARSHGAFAGLSFGALHGVSAALYGAACIAVLLVVWNHDFR
jgi:hypothetical protein